MGKVIDHIREIYLDEGKNCAETLFRAGLRSRGQEVSTEGRRAMIGFGGGFSVGSVCGAIVGGVAAIGCLVGSTDAEDDSCCKEATARFYALCKDAFSVVDCDAIKPVYRKEDTRCLYVVERTAEVLETVLREYNV